MAAIYNLEPTPTAKVLLTTASGDILLELFAKQTPLTSRNFLQHCLDGYYNNTIFHRLVPGFIVQGGDPTGTGEGGESIYPGGEFEDEIHSRLKFNRRGLLGMANAGGKGENGSQFFLTLGKAEELTGRNTMFGRVVGDTIFNLVRMGEAELGEGERPIYPTKIISAEILVNPFEDMVRRERVARPIGRGESSKQMVKRKAKRKVGKTLLSFGGEDEENGEDDAAPVVKKAKFNTKLVSGDVEAPSTSQNTGTSKKEPPHPTETYPPKPTKYPPSTSPSPPREPPPPKKPTKKPSPSPTPPPTSTLSCTNAEIAALKASMKRTTLLPPPEPKSKKSTLEQMIPATSIRARKRGGGTGASAGTGTTAEDRRALEMLNAFKRRLEGVAKEEVVKDVPRRASPSSGAKNGITAAADVEGEDDEEAHLCDLHFIANCLSCSAWDKPAAAGLEAGEGGEDDSGWMGHSLSFEKDRLGKDLEWKRKNEELAVIDPREKEREILGSRGKGRGGGGGGRKGRQWDQRIEAGGPSKVTG